MSKPQRLGVAGLVGRERGARRFGGGAEVLADGRIVAEPDADEGASEDLIRIRIII
jgi:hypothetical protein